MTNNPPPNTVAYDPLFHPSELHLEMGLHICEAASGNTCYENFRGQYRYFRFFSLAHLYDGRGVWRSPAGEALAMESGDAVLTPPGVVHWYSAAPGAHWSEDTICFQGEIADRFLRCGIISGGVFHLGPTRRLQPIINLARDPASENQIKANMALMQLLNEIFFERRALPTGGRKQIVRLLAALNGDPRRWWTVAEMAEMCRLNIDWFRRCFREETGMLPKEYVDQLKIRLAADLLGDSSRTVGAVARELGYRDVFHFSRRFKILTGEAPQTYRDRIFKDDRRRRSS